MYPACLSAFWYCSISELNNSLVLEMEDSLRLMLFCRFLMMQGGWFDLASTYLMLVLGLVYGLYEMVCRSRWTSRNF